MDKPERAALIVGAGDAIGAAILEKFAREGYAAVGVRRSPEKLGELIGRLTGEGLVAHAWQCDARKEEDVQATIARVEVEVGPLEVVVFNVGANVPMPLLSTEANKFFKMWEMACFAGFLTGREAAKAMLPRGRGTIIFTGATASLRGAAGFGAFASAKHGLRALAQSLAREVGPQGIHVAHVVIDAMVDTEWIRKTFLPLKKDRKEYDITRPASIAAHYFAIHNQPRDAWTFESDLRPWCEKW